jgi:hypothetical protein
MTENKKLSGVEIFETMSSVAGEEIALGPKKIRTVRNKANRPKSQRKKGGFSAI